MATSLEMQKSQGEKWGTRIKYGGIIAGLLGLLSHVSGLFWGGLGIAAAGKIFESKNKKTSTKIS